jgi:rhodanese-related sulfurtransferase
MLHYATFLAHPFEVGMSRKHTRISHISSESASHRKNKIHKRNLTWLWIGLGALLVAVVGILVFGPKATPSVEITPAQAYAKFQQGAFFLDVRSQAEWDQFHIKGSTLIPLDQLQNRLSELPKDKDIVVVCLSGHRSLSGTTILQQAGFTRVSCLSGGLQAWITAGYPVQGKVP